MSTGPRCPHLSLQTGLQYSCSVHTSIWWAPRHRTGRRANEAGHPLDLRAHYTSRPRIAVGSPSKCKDGSLLCMQVKEFRGSPHSLAVCRARHCCKPSCQSQWRSPCMYTRAFTCAVRVCASQFVWVSHVVVCGARQKRSMVRGCVTLYNACCKVPGTRIGH